MARKVQPKLRIYAPIIVRDKENEGVKFWGFGKTVYQSLLNYFLDADYGDLSDPNTGRDVIVKFTPPAGSNAFGTTAIMPKPNQTPVVNNPQELQRLVDSVPHINDIFEEKSYDDVDKVWQAFLNQADDADTTASTNLGSEKSFGAPATNTPSQGSEDTSNLDKQFEDVFGS